jgi:hypothetical protein
VAKVLADVVATQPGLLTPKGITDGSNVPAGYVGEFLQFYVPFNIPITWNWTQLVTIGTLPPGDWDVACEVSTGNALVGGISASLNPHPPGVALVMSMQLGIWVSLQEAAMYEAIMPSMSTRANLTVPTLITFQVITNYLGGGGVIAPQAGTGALFFTARRAR